VDFRGTEKRQVEIVVFDNEGDFGASENDTLHPYILPDLVKSQQMDDKGG